MRESDFENPMVRSLVWGDRLLNDWRLGGRGAFEELGTLLERHVLHRTEALLRAAAVPTGSVLLPLLTEPYRRLDKAAFLQQFPEAAYGALLSQLLSGLFRRMAARLERAPRRNENDRLLRHIRACLGFEIEDALVLGFDVEKSLCRLAETQAQGPTLLLEKHILGLTYEEMAQYHGLSVQNVRTMVKKAGEELKNSLSPSYSA